MDTQIYQSRSLSCITNLEPLRGSDVTLYNVQQPQNPFTAPPCIQQNPYPLSQTLLAFHPERHYLFLALQKENFKSITLSYKIPPLESTIATSTDPKVRRKAKKQLSWLRCCIKETSKQEKIILDRLGQVTLQEESRQRWKQIEYERKVGEEMIQRQMGMYQEQLRLTQGMHNMQLNPSIPEFTPSFSHQTFEYPFPNMDKPLNSDAPVWLPMNFSSRSSSRRQSSSQSKRWEELSPLEELSEWASEAETAITTPTPPLIRTPKLGQASSMNDLKLALLSTDYWLESDIAAPKRRGSLPDIDSPVWEGLEKVKAKAKAKLDAKNNDRHMEDCINKDISL